MPTFLEHRCLSNNRDKGKQCRGRESPNGVVPCAAPAAAKLSCHRTEFTGFKVNPSLSIDINV